MSHDHHGRGHDPHVGHDHESVAEVSCGLGRRLFEYLSGYNKPHDHGEEATATPYRSRFALAGAVLLLYGFALLLIARGSLAGVMRGLALENAIDGALVLFVLKFHHDPFDVHDHSRACNVSRVINIGVCLLALKFIASGIQQIHHAERESVIVIAIMAIGVAVNAGTWALLWFVPRAIGRPLALHLAADVPVAAAIMVRTLVTSHWTNGLTVIVLASFGLQVARELMKLLLGLHTADNHLRGQSHQHPKYYFRVP